ncbi:MAG TPA: hypothetical protein VI461_16415 [Chitinophagaceae bacterium]|nr:hypothetical protein [Chitinophagaceae bacterium]
MVTHPDEEIRKYCYSDANYSKKSKLAVPNNTKKMIIKMARPWGKSSEETFLTARIRL